MRSHGCDLSFFFFCLQEIDEVQGHGECARAEEREKERLIERKYNKMENGEIHQKRAWKNLT